MQIKIIIIMARILTLILHCASSKQWNEHINRRFSINQRHALQFYQIYSLLFLKRHRTCKYQVAQNIIPLFICRYDVLSASVKKFYVSKILREERRSYFIEIIRVQCFFVKQLRSKIYPSMNCICLKAAVHTNLFDCYLERPCWYMY